MLSGSVHLFLLLPATVEKHTEQQPILNAELRLNELKARPLQPSAVVSEKQNTEPEQKNEPAVKAENQLSTQDKTAKKIASTVVAHSSTTPPDKTSPVEIQQKGLSNRVDELSSDPLERNYQQQILAHLRNHLAAPQHLKGSVRLSLTIQYGQIATDVSIVRSSGSEEADDWAVRSVIAANPYPPVPTDLPSPFIFRPTIAIGD